jgi:hypothetical protein
MRREKGAIEYVIILLGQIFGNGPSTGNEQFGGLELAGKMDMHLNRGRLYRRQKANDNHEKAFSECKERKSRESL